MKTIFIIILLCFSELVTAQQKLYPPNTKWYQDPVGFRPVELSSAAGFLWGTAAVAACLIFTKSNPAFHKKIFFYEEAGGYFGYKPPYSFSFQNNAGLLYRLRDWMSVGAEINTIHFSDNINDTWTFGLRPFARWYFLKGKNLRLFFEYGAGISYSLNRFPLTGTGYEWDTARTGTKFNFSTKYGIGTEVKISHKFYLQAGARHFHLSNGNIKGVSRNPSYDGNGLFLGLLYTLNP